MRIAVTGAFGYTGRYIAGLLLDRDHEVITLTGHPDRPNPFAGRVPAYPFNFDRFSALVASLRGVEVLVNTYWVRFEHGEVTFSRAVRNSRRLLEAAREAGVARVVHISITNADPQSRLPYFRGKGLLERDVRGSGLSWAILRPAVVFGPEDILVNNIAWLLRRFPVFAIPGDGEYGLQPIFVEDLARLAADAAEASADLLVEATGPRFHTFNEMVGLLKEAVGSRARLVHVPAALALALSRAVNPLVGDILLTRDEVEGLLDNLLVSAAPPAGRTSLPEWLAANRDVVGRGYASELARHYRA